MLQRFVRNGKFLSAYAPGDGAIAFAWINPKTSNVASTLISPHQIRQFQKHSAGKFLARHQIRKINGKLRLVQPITRTGPNTLVVHGEQDRTFHYSVKPNPPFPNNIGLNDITVTTTLTLDDTTVIYDHNVMHISTIAAICFFLNHEKELM